MGAKKSLAVALCAVAVATVAWAAADLTVVSDPSNIVSNRLVGRWVLDPELSRRLDPERASTEPAKLEFTSDDAVLTRLGNYSERLQSDRIFAAGMVKTNGKPHPYILVNVSGNMSLVWFRPDGKGNLIGESETKSVSIAIARDRTKDLLFLGGDTARGASAAFSRDLSR